MDISPATQLMPADDRSPDNVAGPVAREAVYTIGELAKQFGVTLRALRFYESRGLLQPERRSHGRVYGPKEVERLAVIVKAKKLGLTLSEIRQLIGDAESDQTLRLTRETCEAQIAMLERKLAESQEALAELCAIRRLLDERRPDRK